MVRRRQAGQLENHELLSRCRDAAAMRRRRYAELYRKPLSPGTGSRAAFYNFSICRSIALRARSFRSL